MRKQLILVAILLIIYCQNAFSKVEMTHLATLVMYDSENTFTVFYNASEDSLYIIYVKSLSDSFLTAYNIENGFEKFLSDHQNLNIDPYQYRVCKWGDNGLLNLKLFAGQMDSSYTQFSFFVYGPTGTHIFFRKESPVYQTEDLIIFNRVLYIRKDE